MQVKEDLGLLEIQRLMTSEPIPGVQEATGEDYSVVCAQARIPKISVEGIRRISRKLNFTESNESQSSLVSPLKTHWPLLSGEGPNNPVPEAKQVLL